ncbi:carbon-phosphorus lyase complex subunit PhnI [Piscinibacter gummiphilus]|uniref:Carbon-phosphorus lyase complex subunit PhnI n=1 Tax=Piscinibacter gummiphilus TaxID=946333 RepID=A0A1W6L6S7_9BURK|nr:carbon-phosphorus lyase complex subunit PhnI [Piscinibacter gummiphilus]ARN19985.1 carbon-phosphorus lyase complex subunit PhnI [Piscinibacter gummiphilus]ATU64655.1 carbon-phosphorus lyase complex subunit PhnI [Piscinibacter gummiphilus]GLS94919.1 carbon-phosphorus lyase complex subunit PhnI [Piscinibacter gummiphilus]
MYIAVKGGEAAIAASWRLLDEARRGDRALRELEVAQIREQLGLLVDRVMAEGSLYDPELAALALKQARGDAIEAAFLIRAYRTTLPRFAFTEPVDTDRMRVSRRISAIFKDLPGGQLLGPTFDYTQRLLDFRLLEAGSAAPLATPASAEPPPAVAPALKHLADEGLVEPAVPSAGDPEPDDITRHPPAYPTPRPARLQMLSRADEGWLLGLAYSTQRGYANTHPFAGEVRHGHVAVEVVPDELGFPIEIGEIELTECQMVNQFVGSANAPPQFTRGHGLAFGHGERRAMAMSLVDRVLRADEFDEEVTSPAQQQEFALPHGDNIEASGFVQHLKLPHYVTFESELHMVRTLRSAQQAETP